jgi:WD40 repeat protein
VSKKGAHSSSSGQQPPQLVAEYSGHKEAVQAVAAHPVGSWCCSGGWDGQLLLWRTGKVWLRVDVESGCSLDFWQCFV